MPKTHNGPGWANMTVTVYFQEKGGGDVSFEIFQYSELNEEMRTLFEIGETINNKLVEATERMISNIETK